VSIQTSNLLASTDRSVALLSSHIGMQLRTMTEMAKSEKEWKRETALIDKEMLSRHLTTLQGPIYNVAGPPTMVAAMRQTLVKAGVEEDDIRAEEFAGY
jgi:ferredoxin-NADP reductase